MNNTVLLGKLSLTLLLIVGCKGKSETIPEPPIADEAEPDESTPPSQIAPTETDDPDRCPTLDEVAGEMVSARATARKMTIPPTPEPIGRCVDAWEVALGDSVRPDCRTSVVAGACKDIFTEQPCNEAWSRVDLEFTRTQLVETYDACKQTYCNKLAEPQPASCTSDSWPESDKELTKVWTELLLAIVNLEHGSSVSEKDLTRLSVAFVYLSIQADSPLAMLTKGKLLDETPSEQGTPSVICLARTGQETVLLLTRPSEVMNGCSSLETNPAAVQGKWILPDSPSPEDIAPLLESLDSKNSGIQITIMYADDVDESLVEFMENELKSAGYMVMTLAPTQEPSDSPYLET